MKKNFNYEVNRKRFLQETLNKLLSICWGDPCYKLVLQKRNKTNELFCKDLDDCVNLNYKINEANKEIELLLSKILFLISLLQDYESLYKDNYSPRQWTDKQYWHDWLKLIKNIENVISNSKNQLSKFMNDYEINYETWPINFKINNLLTINNNLKNIPKEFSDPINKLFEPQHNDFQLLGLIATVRRQLEGISNKKELEFLNSADLSIYQRSLDLSRFLANQFKDGLHKGLSELTIRDGAHTLGMLASLVHKIIEINQKNLTQNISPKKIVKK